MKPYLLTILVLNCAMPEELKINEGKLSTVFEKYTQSSSIGKSLFMQLKNKAVNGATFKDLDEHVQELEGHLEQDEFTNQKLYQAELERLQSEVFALEEELKQLESQQKYLQQKLETINDQSQQIDILFSADHDAFIRKIGEQYTLIEAIDELISQINDKQGTVTLKSELLEQLKLIGEDQHINILALVTVNMNKESINKIIDLFQELKQVIKETVEADEFTNESNVQLHTEIREQIASLIPETLELQEETNKSIEEQRKTLIQTQQQLEDLQIQMKQQSEERKQAIEKVQEAQEILKNNIDNIIEI